MYFICDGDFLDSRTINLLAKFESAIEIKLL